MVGTLVSFWDGLVGAGPCQQCGKNLYFPELKVQCWWNKFQASYSPKWWFSGDFSWHSPEKNHQVNKIHPDFHSSPIFFFLSKENKVLSTPQGTSLAGKSLATSVKTSLAKSNVVSFARQMEKAFKSNGSNSLVHGITMTIQ